MIGCAGGGSPPAKTAPAPPSAPPQDSVKSEQTLPRDVLGALDEAIPPARATCSTAGPLPTQVPCADARERLARGLASAAPDAALSSLEVCAEFEPGLVRALRVELGPVECGDVLVASVVGESASRSHPLSRGIRELLLAQGISARLRRLAGTLPGTPSDRKKATIVQFLEERVFPWAKREAIALEKLARQGSELRGYARGIAAVEAGMADMRFVSLVRDVPIPEEMLADEEVREVYYTSLEEALDARKNRGRDASLVGLLELERTGVVFDARIERARELLVHVFGGSRLRALDGLLIPEPKSSGDFQDVSLRIAGSVPTPYVPLLVGDAPLTGKLLTALARRGLPPGWDQSASELSDEERLTLAWIYFHRGRTYFRSSDFLAASELVATIPHAAPQSVEAEFLRGICLALSSGPSGPVDVMRRGSFVGVSLGSPDELQRLGESDSPLAGPALFNRAYLTGLALPPGAVEDWGRLAEQFRRASKKLSRGVTLASLPEGPFDAKAYASDAARAAQATRDAIQADQKRAAQGAGGQKAPKESSAR